MGYFQDRQEGWTTPEADEKDAMREAGFDPDCPEDRRRWQRSISLTCISDRYDRDGATYSDLADFQAMCKASFGGEAILSEQADGTYRDETGATVLEPTTGGEG